MVLNCYEGAHTNKHTLTEDEIDNPSESVEISTFSHYKLHVNEKLSFCVN